VLLSTADGAVLSRHNELTGEFEEDLEYWETANGSGQVTRQGLDAWRADDWRGPHRVVHVAAGVARAPPLGCLRQSWQRRLRAISR
jgi:hypothetical protein